MSRIENEIDCGLKPIVVALIDVLSDPAADLVLVDYVKYHMIKRLREKREQGRGGWYKLQVIKTHDLELMLKDQVDQGNMIDVINIAAMIAVRRELYKKDVL